MKIRLLLSTFYLLVALTSCEKKMDKAALDTFSNSQLEHWNKNLSSIIIKDIFTPPVASRIYAYTHIAAYEALVPAYPEYQSLAGQLNGLSTTPKPEPGKTYYFPAASIKAFSTVCKKLTLVPANTEVHEEEYLQKLRDLGIDEEVLSNSLEYGEKVGKHILAWAKKDNYLETRAMTKHDISKKTNVWQPTPPDYLPAVEPHWHKIRPFVLDSAAQCKPHTPTTFDTIPTSSFYAEAREIYEIGRENNKEHQLIARYWDDNPNVSVTKGHVTYFKQKLTPGGHWISIATQVIKDKKLNLMQASETYVLVSTSLADGFISCWDAKFKYVHIRPDTYIQRYIDENWTPLIQTPPFPEFPSGHSVISAAAATTLTHLFGENYTFTDSTQLAIDLPARRFTSFYNASDEAGMSRMYGGIHFRPANKYGAQLGKDVGKQVCTRLKTRKHQNLATL